MKNRYLRLIRKQRGFTLIELLAVILILGIIALIAIPVVSSVVEESRRGAALQSANTYISEVEKQIIMNQMSSEYEKIVDGEYNVPLLPKYGIKIKGDKPEAGNIIVTDGKITSYYLIINGYVVTSNGVVGSKDDVYSGPDVYLFDLADVINIETGDLDLTSGEPVEHGRRVRTINYQKMSYDKYDITIDSDYILTIFEYDSDKNYLSYVSFNENSVYEPNSKASYYKVALRGATGSIEKTLSFGQWVGRLNSGLKAKISVGDLENISTLNNNIIVSVDKSATSLEIQNALINDSKELMNLHWNALVSNGVYKIEKSKLYLDKRKTYYISGNGNDSNSGLSANYPRKTLKQFSGVNNINILIESGYTYDMSGGFTVGNNVTIASYGKGNRPVLNYYRDLKVPFVKVDGEDNLYVADLTSLSIYKGTGDKGDCNIGQLLIDGVVNWKRRVYESGESFAYTMLTNKKDEKSWAIDTANAKLYIYSTTDPNKSAIRYAPPSTALSAKGANNIIVQGIEITGAGLHGINFTNTTNVDINGCSFKYIGGSILTSAGTRYGNAIQIWDSATNVIVRNNIANWIYDTCYTNQGSSTSMMLKDVIFKNNIGAHSQWGLETWGDGGKGFENIEYAHNLLYKMGDITNPNTKMQCSSSGHLYGEVDGNDYISYRYGYTFHQAANLAVWAPTVSYMPSIHDNIFWGTNRYLVIGTWSSSVVDIDSLKDNLFYEEYYLSYNTAPALYKFKTSEDGKNKYLPNVTDITSDSSNIQSSYKRGSEFDNTLELDKMRSLIELNIN